LIFTSEIMPYTKKPKRAQKQYKKWKKKQRTARDIHIKLRRFADKPLCAFCLKLWFYARYPIGSVRGFLANPAKLKKMFRNI